MSNNIGGQVKEALDHGADIEVRDEEDGTPLYAAVYRGHFPGTDPIKRFLDKLHNVQVEDRSSQETFNQV
jgi:hypothetical protein